MVWENAEVEQGNYEEWRVKSSFICIPAHGPFVAPSEHAMKCMIKYYEKMMCTLGHVSSSASLAPRPSQRVQLPRLAYSMASGYMCYGRPHSSCGCSFLPVPLQHHSSSHAPLRRCNTSEAPQTPVASVIHYISTRLPSKAHKHDLA